MNLIEPHSGLLLWTLLIVGILLVILGKFAWKPILEAIDARENTIKESLAEAEKAREEAKKFKEEHDKRVKEAQDEIATLLRTGRESAEKLREKMVTEAREESETIRKKNKDEMERDSRKVAEELKKDISLLSLEIASKIIHRELQKEEHERLINESIETISSEGNKETLN